MKPVSPTAQVVDINSPELSPALSPSPVKFSDFSDFKSRKQPTNVNDENKPKIINNTAFSSNNFTTTSNESKPIQRVRRKKKKNVSRDDKPVKRKVVDPTSIGNIKGKLRMLSDSRNLRFRKLYKPPEQKVVWIFIAMVITWYCLFTYFGPQYKPTEYKPSSSTFNPAGNIKLHRRKSTTVSTP
jgi:hypothetical protein